MTDDDFNTIYAIALEAPARIQVWCASTPTGRRGTFYSMCQGTMKGWKQFYFPSTVNPEWDSKMEEELRSMFSTEVAWQHEVLAEFGEEVIGVFKKEFIDRAKANYDYFNQPDNMFSHIMIGTDWDKYNAATQIVITGYNISLQKFQVINRIEIPKSEFTLHNAVQRLIQLNEVYDPDFIYVDRGFGEFQVETLHIYGDEHPESGMRKKVKGWAFGSSYEIRDPITKEVVKTPLKPFMVNQLVYMFEQDLIILNENDKLMWKQLEDYTVVRFSQDNRPIFTNENEHTVDALTLSILAFQLEFPDLAKILKEQKVARIFTDAKMHYSDPFKEVFKFEEKQKALGKKNKIEWDEPSAPPPKRVPLGTGFKQPSSWGHRGTGKRASRKSW
jgi:replicative DNA helicase